jgi:hypothetical protein
MIAKDRSASRRNIIRDHGSSAVWKRDVLCAGVPHHFHVHEDQRACFGPVSGRTLLTIMA